MSRRPHGFKEMRAAREKKANAAREQMLQRFKDHHLAAERERQTRAATLDAKRKRFAGLSIGAALAAARRLTFLDLEAQQKGATLSLNRPTLALLELVLKALQDRTSTAILAVAARFAGRFHPSSPSDVGHARLFAGTGERRLQLVPVRTRFQDALLSVAWKRHWHRPASCAGRPPGDHQAQPTASHARSDERD